MYPLPIKMQISECLIHFNSRRCDETMVIQENKLRIIAPALSNKVLPVPSAFSSKLHPCSAIMNHSNDEVMLLKRFFDGL